MTVIGNLIRVILFVENMTTMVQFYRDIMGFAVIQPGVDDYADQYWVELATGGCRLTLHGGGQQRLGADAPKLAFQVDDIEAARQRLLEKGVKIGEIRSPAPGVLIADGVDPEGNRFSIDAYNQSGVDI